jgi:hypothetical protein
VVVGFLGLVDTGKDGKSRRAAKEKYEVHKYPLVMNRWNRIVMNYDRLWVSISVDSYGHGAVKRLEKVEGRPIYVDEEANLVIGGKDGLFVGRVDDMKVAGILSGEPESLPDEVEVEGKQRRIIHFLDGKLDPKYHSVSQEIVLVYEGVPSLITIGMLGNILMK